MSLGILNNVAALYAENNLNRTQASLQSTLQQLSSGSRINSGADDPSGLAVSDGMTANVTALTQSGTNAASGIGFLQTADGALAQVTSLLDQAITLATEASNGTLTSNQISSANQEYQNILTQIGNIGSATNFNSTKLFTANATSIVVTDGTSSGTNLYSDTVGVLTRASVGTTVGTVVVTGTVAGTTSAASIQNTAPAISKSAGQYSLTAGASTDIITGTISFTIGGGTQQNISLAGDSLTTVSNLLTSAGLANSVSSNIISITGPVTGADAAANTVNFSGTSLTIAPPATSLAAGSYSTLPTTLGQPATVSVTLAGNTVNTRNGNSTADLFSGTIILNQAGQLSKTITIAANSLLDNVNNAGGVEYQIAQQLAGSGYALADDTGTWSNPVLNFTGADTSSPLTINASSTFHNATTVAATANASAGAGGVLPGPLQKIYTFTALGSCADTFGSAAGNANMLDINGTNLSVAALTAAAAKTAIDTTFQSAGISASVSADGSTLTILGNTDGTALSVLGHSGNPLALTDKPPSDWLTGNAVGTPADLGQGGTGTLSLSGASNGDTFGGNFTLSQGSTNVTIVIAPGTDDLMNLEFQVQIQSMGKFSTFASGGSNPTFTINGSNSPAPITYTAGTFADSTTPSATFTGVGIPGIPPTQGTYNLAALSSSSDTFGSSATNANTLRIQGTEIAIGGMTATEAMQAINGNLTMQSAGISATVNGAGTQVTLLGNASGTGFSVFGHGGSSLALSDSQIPSGGVSQITAPIDGPAGSGTSVISMGNSTDTLSGTLSVVVNGKTASLTVAANTTGQQLQDQINLDSTFKGASLAAVYNSAQATITITGPAGAGNTLNTSATSLTDTTAPTQNVAGIRPGAGANFTVAGLSVLTAASAAAILAKVTEAVADVAYQRGTLGADINQLTSAAGVASVQSVNLASAQNSISATDYGSAASNLSKYQILSQTGISALAQANTVQQEVLKLLQ